MVADSSSKPRRSSISGIKSIGIDLGSANTLIYIHNKGIVLREPSVVAFNTNDGSIAAIGKDAKAMIGKTPQNITVVKPLSGGVIADFDITKLMVKHYLKLVLNKFSISKPWVVISIPYGTTDIERRAVMEAASQSGAKKTLLIEEPLAAAIGANLPVEEALGSMIVNIGAGTTEIAVISLGGIVNAISSKIAGDSLDIAIYNYMKKKYRLEIGLITAEKIKINHGNIMDSTDETADIRGINLKTGLPTLMKIPTNEINNVLQETLKELISAIRKVFENTPPQLASDIIEKGLVLTGGGANLPGIDELISSKIKLPVTIPASPEDCVALGTGTVATNTTTLTRISLLGTQHFT